MLKMHPGDEQLLHFWPEIDIYESSIKETRFPLWFLTSFSHEHISPGYVWMLQFCVWSIYKVEQVYGKINFD